MKNWFNALRSKPNMNATYFRLPRDSEESERQLLTPTNEEHQSNDNNPARPVRKRFRLGYLCGGPAHVVGLVLVLITGSCLTDSYTKNRYDDAGRVIGLILPWITLISAGISLALDMLQNRKVIVTACEQCQSRVHAPLPGLGVLTTLLDATLFALLLASAIVGFVTIGRWTRPTQLVGAIFAIFAA
jgi:hypothetical protein